MATRRKSAAWRDYQEKAAELLRKMGFTATVEEVLEGARGKHAVDVVARTTLGGVPVTWIVECKHWKTPVPKAHVLTLAQIAQDTGADRAVLLSQKGFQAGAINVSHKSNVLLTSLEELETAAADSIAELSIRRTLLRVKTLEKELQEILFDYGPRVPPPPEMDETITLLGACLEVTLAVVASQTGRFPIRLPGTFSNQTHYADELPAVAAALASTVDQIGSKYGPLKLAIAQVLKPYIEQSGTLVDLVRKLVAAGDELLDPSAEDEETHKLEAIVGAMRAVGDCAETLRSVPSAPLSQAVGTLMRQLIDGAYLWFADPQRTPEAWGELRAQIDETVRRVADAAEKALA